MVRLYLYKTFQANGNPCPAVKPANRIHVLVDKFAEEPGSDALNKRVEHL